ncbi:hypothetical protein Tco_1122071 [Tanacetum coccineum]|uniref:Uncharacterized protein n=1 Tax=Tanacetum coccineum TaxID=301880 RepID=A0ABQ5IZY8_9ASTR
MSFVSEILWLTKTKRKRIPPSSKPEASKIVKVSPPKEQANESQPAKEPMVQKSIDEEFVKESGLESLGDIPLEEFGGANAKLDADKSPYDTESEIKREEEPAAFDLHSMPDDEVMSIYGFEAADSNDKGTEFNETKVSLTQSEEDTTDTLKTILPNIFEESIHKPLNKELNALNTLESQRFETLQEQLLKVIRAKMGKSVKKTVWKEIDIVKDRISYSGGKLDKGELHMQELISLMKDMVSFLDAANVFEKIKAEGEKGDPQQIITTSTEEATIEVQGEQPKVQELSKLEEAPLVNDQPPSITKQVPLMSTTLVIHASEDKALEEKISEEEPPTKSLKLLIPNLSTTLPIPMCSIFLQNITVDQFTDTLFNTTSSKYSPTPHRDESKGTTSTTLTAKLPILNPGDYDLWLMRIEQYFLMTDYSLFGKKSQDRRNEMKARGPLLIALLNKIK